MFDIRIHYAFGHYLNFNWNDIILILKVDDWPWIRYKYCSSGKWKDDGIRYTVADVAVINVLDPPDIKMEGRSLFYIFSGGYKYIY
jgi:hypothetical protein